MFIRNIVIKGGVHNDCHYPDRANMTEEQLEQLKDALLNILHQFTPTKAPGWITVEYTKELGGKTHS